MFVKGAVGVCSGGVFLGGGFGNFFKIFSKIKKEVGELCRIMKM